jgi:DNA-directed RNA polymerase II subunit RPB1
MTTMPPETIEHMQFYVLGDEETLEDSYVEVRNKDLFRQSIPIVGGLYDAHMGTTDHAWRCLTCHNSKMLCPGHFGHINLNYPTQSHMYKDDIIQWLKIICFECGNLIINKLSALTSVTKYKKLGEYVKLTRNTEKNINCISCNALHPHIVRDKNRQVTIWAEFYKGAKLEKKYQLYNHMIATIFERISNTTVKEMGKESISHPRKLILNIMRVPPNSIRPDIKKIGGGRSNNNDLTTLTKAIVEINNNLPTIIPNEISDELEANYTNMDMTYYELVKGTPSSSGKNKITTNTNRPPSSISSRFPSKGGRIRRNLMGKRTWYSARSVITCDPMLRIDELGIPKAIATGIQIPETVNSRNMNRLMIYFSNKGDIYPGCTKVLKKRTGVEHWVGSLNRDFVLEEGDVIMRDLIDGDVVIFNRQPSMLGHSMTCHKAIILDEGNTIRMNISACVLYSADFDGDAMNLFFARSTQTRNEIQTLANVGVSFISKASGRPLLGCFQDTLASMVEITRNDILISKYNTMELFKNVPMSFTKDTYTGRELVSMLLPHVNFNTKAMFYNKSYAPYLDYKHDEVNVVIRRGVVEGGVMDHRSCGQERDNSIFHIINNEYGPTLAQSTLFNIQQVVMEFIYNKGYSVGVDDITITPQSLTEIQVKTSALVSESYRITDKLRMGEIIPPIGMTIGEFYEQQQICALALGDDFVKPILSDIDIDNNAMYKMIEMCKKGKMKNLQSITSAMGSSLINGERPALNFGYSRTLPYYPRFDTDPISNGFVPNSFITGISPDSFLFTSQEARYGVINKALSTSISGHQGRESVKNLESIITNNLRQCCKGYDIVQFIYGGNGIDTRRLEKVNITTIMISDAELEETYHSDVSLFGKMFQNKELQKLLDDEFNQLVLDRKEYREMFTTTEYTFDDMPLSSKIQSPVDIHRIINDIIYDFKDAVKKPLDPVNALGKIASFYKDLPYIYINTTQKALGGVIPQRYKYAVQLLSILIRNFLNTKYLVTNGVSNIMLGLIMDKVLVTVQKSLIDYGTAVGIIAAQSLSEPMTQYIISSHHRSGVSGGSQDVQTDKLTRSTEIMLAKITEKMKNPSMTLYVKEEYEDNSVKVNEIANHIENMRLYRFLDELQIFFEEYKNPVHPDYKHEVDMIDDYEKHNPNIIVPTDLTHWVIRIELNRLKMILKNMDLETIIFGIMSKYPKLFVVYSAENDDKIIVRCYIRNAQFKRSHTVNQNDVELLKDSIIDTVIRGVDNINIAIVKKSSKSFIDDDGSVKSKPIYIIKTNGTNLSDILENPYLDVNKCQTDSIKEIEEIYGIEAARQRLRSELEKIIPGMQQAHYTIYSDEMCQTGRVTGISKTGLEKRESLNVLLRASYSFMNQVLKTAAVNSQSSTVYGMSAPLMLGRSPYVGSCYNSIAIDQDFIKDNVKNMGDIIDDL